MYRVWVQLESNEWAGQGFKSQAMAWAIRDILFDRGYTQVRVKAEGEYGYYRQGWFPSDLLTLGRREFERS